MVALKGFLLAVAAGIIGVAPITSAQRLYDDGSLSLRDFDVYASDLSARSVDSEILSIREYIDEQIELALREYDDIFDDLAARHTKEEIAAQVARWTNEVNRSKPVVRAANDKFKAASKNKAKDPKAYQKAKNELDTARGALEGYEENLHFWSRLTPSPSPPPGKGKGRK
jgi:hypothetical protein